ncbi:MAG: ABC transporter permease [Firmicutes bacterium]|nr:ABC transporter permease [Bacillota bacterium]
MRNKTVRRYLRNHLAVVGAILFAVIALAAPLAPYLSPYDYAAQDLDQRLKAPSAVHVLGTDGYGRDVLSRVIWGARVSLEIGMVAAGLSILLGIAIGAIAGFFGGAVDTWITRFIDIFMSIPALFLVLIIVALFGANVRNTMVVIGLVYWPGTARIVRAEFLRLRQFDFTEAARAMGATVWRIIVKQLLPNALPPIIVQATLFVGEAILIESGLSYLGLGAQPPLPSWGNMLVEGRRFLASAWWIATFPGLAIFLSVLSLNLLGDGLRDAIDPRLR